MMITSSEVIEALAQFRDSQLETWHTAKVNYDALTQCLRKNFTIGKFEGVMQYNPARKISTAAKVDKDSIRNRPCFLCKENRPEEQYAEEITEGWELLINPYPILPLHFTIAANRHIPQTQIPLDMATMAERLPGMVIFFNGARAGASAPDHLHCQAVMASELPLIQYLESGKPVEDLPFDVIYDKVTPDMKGMITLNSMVLLKGKDGVTGKEDAGLLNAYFWIGADGLLRIAVIPRKAHRPQSYTDTAEGDGMMVSPGAIDMAGLVVLPRKRDFDNLTSVEIEQIYHDTAW